jgi:glutamine synthetase
VDRIDLVTLATCDLGAVVRGRSVPARDLDRRLETGVGWVPANLSLMPLGGIADPNPFGALGDLRLRPDASTLTRLSPIDGGTPLGLILCDIAAADGAPWACCPRRALRAALDTLETAIGAHAVGAFEHEFALVTDEPCPASLSLTALRAVDPLGPIVMAALDEAGVEPEMFLAEFGAHQFEVPCAPARGIAIADRAIILREVVRDVAQRLGHRVTFAPLSTPDGVGSGAHLHLSLVDAAGAPLLFDADGPAGLSELGGSFAAGILRHAPALTALVAPSPVSARRLSPHRWSASGAFLGERHREAFVRVPAPEHDDAAASFNLELRAVDATANPYLALATTIRAGLAGVRDRLPAPPVVDRELADGERDELRVVPLPRSLAESLAALEADAEARGWLGSPLCEAYLTMKRGELATAENLDDDALCRAYASAY